MAKQSQRIRWSQAHEPKVPKVLKADPWGFARVDESAHQALWDRAPRLEKGDR
jgi:hypothetical protein